MGGIILEFESKVKEVNEYFSFISTTTPLKREFDKSKIVKVSEIVHNVLKANLFLLLYNLIEASFKNSLENFCIKITDDKLKYKSVIPEIRKIWIDKQYKNFESTCVIPREIQKSEFLMNKIDNIAQDIINIEFDNELSGNVTTKQIKDLTTQYGLQSNEILEKEANSLFIIKNKRNNLAHGNESFSECGRDYTLEKLKEIKDESVDYMRFILTHIKTFIDDEQYKI